MTRIYNEREIADAYTRFRMAIKGNTVDTAEFVRADEHQELVSALRHYARHSDNCGDMAGYNGQPHECDCGLAAVLAEADKS
jgi:hypothetical protein